MWWGCQIGQKLTGLIRPYVNWLRDLGGLDHPFPSVAGLPDWATSPDGRTLKVGRILTGLNEELRFIEYLQTIPEKKRKVCELQYTLKWSKMWSWKNVIQQFGFFRFFWKKRNYAFSLVKTFQQIYFKLLWKLLIVLCMNNTKTWQWPNLFETRTIL